MLQVLCKMLASFSELLQGLWKGWFTICCLLKQVIDMYFTSNMDNEKFCCWEKGWSICNRVIEEVGVCVVYWLGRW